MKKLLLSLIFCFVCHSIFAQDTTISPSFLGISLQSNIKTLTEHLTNKGFQIANHNEEIGSLLLSGKYDSIDCNIEIQKSPFSDQILNLKANFVTDSVSITPKERSIFKTLYADLITSYKNQENYEIISNIDNISQIDTLENNSISIAKHFSEEDSLPLPLVTLFLTPQEFVFMYADTDFLRHISNALSNYSKTRDTYYFKGIPIEGKTKPFVQTLLSQGYTLDDRSSLDDDFITLKGKFFGERVSLYIKSCYNQILDFITVVFLEDFYLSEYRPALYRRIRTSLINKYPETDNWKHFEENEDISALTDKEMHRQVSIYKKTYMFRVFDNPNIQSSPYIALVLSETGLHLYYQNPNTKLQIEQAEVNDL